MQLRHTRRQVVHGLAAAAATAFAPALRAESLRLRAEPRMLPALRAVDLQGRDGPLIAPGRAAVLNFWASWCEPCRTEMPSLQQLADFHGDRLSVVAVNFKERAATAARFMQRGGFTLPVMLDPEGAIARALDVKVFPSTFGVGADGRVRWRVQGAADWSGPQALDAVEGLMRAQR